MRLQPVARPRGLLLRVAFWMARRRFGRVPTPFRVVYARAPKLAPISYQIARVLEGGLSLEPELVLLLMTHVSQQNGCGFCADLHLAQAVQARLTREKFAALPEFRASPRFSERERAALAFAEEVTRTHAASDAAFRELQKHFDERQIVELTWLNAVGNFFNLLAVPLGLESDGLEALARQRAAA
jgi:AhpD family alkylhydroperoxidase